jgi:hypothetical protein
VFFGGVAPLAGALACACGDPAIAGPLCVLFVPAGGTVDFGAKKRAHNKITPIDSNDAAKSRISWLKSLFFPGSLTKGPHGG